MARITGWAVTGGQSRSGPIFNAANAGTGIGQAGAAPGNDVYGLREYDPHLDGARVPGR